MVIWSFRTSGSIAKGRTHGTHPGTPATVKYPQLNICIRPTCKYGIKKYTPATVFLYAPCKDFKTARFGLRNGLFRRLKRHVSDIKTARFAMLLEIRGLGRTAFAATINIRMLTVAEACRQLSRVYGAFADIHHPPPIFNIGWEGYFG